MAISAQELNVILSARDKQFTQAMDRAQRRVERMSKQSVKELGKTSRAFDNLGKMASQLGGVLSAGALATGFVSLVRNATDAAVQIDNLSRVAGVMPERFQEMAFAAGKFGIEQDKLADILKDVNDKFGDFFQNEAGPLKDFFDNIAPKVGITADEFRGLSSDQALGAYVKALQDANVSQAELTFYLEAIASDATLLAPLFLNNAEQLERMSAAGRDLGVVMSNDMITNAVAMRRTFDEVMDVMTAKFRNFALTVVSGFDEIFNITNAEKLDEVNEKIQKIQTENAAISERIRKNVLGESRFPNEERRKADLALQQDKLQTNQELLNNLYAQDQALRDQISSADRLRQTIENLNNGGTANSLSGSTGASTTPEGDEPGQGTSLAAAMRQYAMTRMMAAREAAEGAAEATAEAEKEFKENLSAIFEPFLSETVDTVFENSIADLSPLEQDLARIERRRDDMIARAKAAFKEAGQDLEAYDLTQIENIAWSWYHAEVEAAKYADTQRGALTETQTNALNAAEALRQLTPEMQRLQDVMQTVEGSMERAFMAMIDGSMSAKDAFRLMASDIIKELYRIYFVKRITSFITDAIGLFTGPAPGSSASILGSAAGGQVSPGEPRVVGEHGREIFVPSSSGRVLSVPQAKAAVNGGGGPGIVINQNLEISTGVSQTVKAEVQQMLPKITEATKAAVADAARRGGSYAKAFS